MRLWKTNHPRKRFQNCRNQTRYGQIGSKSTNYSQQAWRKEGLKVTLVAVIGGFRSDLWIMCMIDENLGNVSVSVLFFSKSRVNENGSYSRFVKPIFLEQYYSYCEYRGKDSSFFFCLVSCFVSHEKHHGKLKSKRMPEFFYSSYLVYEHAVKHKCKTWISQRDFNTKCRNLLFFIYCFCFVFFLQ